MPVTDQHNSAPDPHRAFAAFGRVMAGIAAFEQILRLVLGEFEAASLGQKGQHNREALARVGKKILGLDFGGLIHQAYNKLNLCSEILEILKEAKQARNYLAHNFWGANFGHLHSVDGIEIIVRQCLVFESMFRRLAEGIINETNVDVQRYIDHVRTAAAERSVLAEWDRVLLRAEAEAERGQPLWE